MSRNMAASYARVSPDRHNPSWRNSNGSAGSQASGASQFPGVPFAYSVWLRRTNVFLEDIRYKQTEPGRAIKLDLRGNQLRGEIPPELGNLASLIWLDLRENQLTGEIPPELGNLANLTRLFPGGNRLSGCVAGKPAR